MFASYEQTYRIPHPPGPHEQACVLLNAESRVSPILLPGELMPEAPGARRVPLTVADLSRASIGNALPSDLMGAAAC
ncbi:hypothetical protein [uncultured Pseudacidovorax sp.]|uniref:hypothetical protein n=1 Tax=uncultured Pseudacidovorax sp. TaxID=679313 RepID=UPI0025FFD192|nr:hypothetical protein [uncultured Pseudacidovorax sp.]